MGGDDPVLNNQNYINPRDMAAMPVEATSGFTCTWRLPFNGYIDDSFFFPEIHILSGFSLTSQTLSNRWEFALQKVHQNQFHWWRMILFSVLLQKVFISIWPPAMILVTLTLPFKLKRIFKKERVTIRIFLYLPNRKYPGGIVVSVNIKIVTLIDWAMSM